jgi:hypothetical protein
LVMRVTCRPSLACVIVTTGSGPLGESRGRHGVQPATRPTSSSYVRARRLLGWTGVESNPCPAESRRPLGSRLSCDCMRPSASVGVPVRLLVQFLRIPCPHEALPTCGSRSASSRRAAELAAE